MVFFFFLFFSVHISVLNMHVVHLHLHDSKANCLAHSTDLLFYLCDCSFAWVYPNKCVKFWRVLACHSQGDFGLEALLAFWGPRSSDASRWLLSWAFIADMVSLIVWLSDGGPSW